MCDLQFCNHGSFASCTPLTDVGQEWMQGSIIDGNSASGDCVGTVYIDHRYLEDIVLGARADGLVCEG